MLNSLSLLASAAEKRTYETETIEINDGTKDVSSSPSKMLLLRQLDHLSTEESIYNAVHSLQGVYRAILIRDKLTKMSCEFAFVEFSDIEVITKCACRDVYIHANVVLVC